MWLIIYTYFFSFYRLDNEIDVLPSALQFIDQSWLPNDWYLNLSIAYRQPFNLIAGSFITLLGFQYGAYFGRAVVYLLLSISLFIYIKTFRLRYTFALAGLLFFFKNQSLIACEWIIAGFDTKTIAYSFVFLSLSNLYKKDYFKSFLFAGAAISFHVLVGLHALFCSGFVLLLTGNLVGQWRDILRNSWVFPITGIFGILAIIQQLAPSSEIDSAFAWKIYVEYRVPHHVLPSAWNGDWISLLAISTFFFIAIIVERKDSPSIRFIAGYSIGSLMLFLMGLLVFAFADPVFLRLYWFRFPDTIIPFSMCLLTMKILGDFAVSECHSQKYAKAHFQIKRVIQLGIPILTSILLMIIFLNKGIYLSKTRLLDDWNSRGVTRSILTWINKNTDKGAVFLVYPGIQDFYLHAQRAMFVSYKHSPQSAVDIMEWYERIKLTNGGQFPSKRGFAALEELEQNFYQLNEQSILWLSKQYGISYYLGKPLQNLRFKRVYSDSYYTLYQLNDHSQQEDQEEIPASLSKQKQR